MKNKYTFEKQTTEYEKKDVSKWLWLVMSVILSAGYILGQYEETPEARTVPHIWEGKGYLIDNKPVFINEHCTE